jgi:tetratricopeptide (TPR) repeat protein
MGKFFRQATRRAAQGAAVGLAIGGLSTPMARAEDERPRSYYPVLTVADLQVCRGQFAAVQADSVRGLRAEAANYAPGGKYSSSNGAADNFKTYSGFASEDAAMDPVSWYARGIGGGEGGPSVGKLEFINEYNDDEFYGNILKGLDGYGRARDPSPANFAEYYYGITEAHYYAAETCVARVWMAKFDKMHPGKKPLTIASPKPVAAPPKPAGDPVQGAAKFKDGMAAFNSGNYPLAIQLYTQAMALDPANAAKWQVTRGIVYGLSGQPDASIRDFTASINAQPNVATGYYYRSGAYIAAGKTALAYADAQTALRLAPNDTGVQRRAQQLGVPMTGNGGASPGTGTSVADTRSAPGGVSVSGPDRTGENTVKSPVIRDAPPPSSVANTGSAGGRKFSINPKTGAPCVIVTGTSTRTRGDGGTEIYLNFANSCNKGLVMIGERIDKKPSPLGPISSTGIGPLEKGRLICIDYPNGTGCTGWKGGWGN